MTRFPRLDIHARIALIAVLPSLVLGLVLIAYFTSSRLADLESAHTQRGKALVRQLAAASEYGVFSGNRESLRKLTKHRGAFPSDEALIKLLYLALRNISKRWTLPIRDWKAALNRFTIQFEGRIPQL